MPETTQTPFNSEIFVTLSPADRSKDYSGIIQKMQKPGANVRRYAHELGQRLIVDLDNVRNYLAMENSHFLDLPSVSGFTMKIGRSDVTANYCSNTVTTSQDGVPVTLNIMEEFDHIVFQRENNISRNGIFLTNKQLMGYVDFLSKSVNV